MECVFQWWNSVAVTPQYARGCLPTWATEILPLVGEEMLRLWPVVENERRRWWTKTVNKSVVTWGTYTFVAELNVWGRCKQLFCLFLWSSPVFFDLAWCQRIASTSPRNYKYWSSWRLGVKWREGLKCPSKIGGFSLCHQSCSYWSICFAIKPCGTFDVSMNGFLNFQKNWYFFVISRFSDVIILIQMNGG